MRLLDPLIFSVVIPSLFLFGVFVGGSGAYELKKQAVEKGYALHCPDNGVWSWKGECDEQN